MAYVLTSDFKTMVTARGKIVGKNFLCNAIPVNELDPEAVSKVLGPNAATMTQIQIGNIRRTNVSCMGCHQPIDTAGMGLEFVDYFGRLRPTYNDGTKIEINFEAPYSSVSNVTDLDSYLHSVSQDDRFHSCFVKTMASRITPIRLEAFDPCAFNIYKLREDQGIRSYVKGLVVSKMFKMAEVGI